MKKCLLLCVMIILCSNTSFAHEDYITSSRSGKVRVSIEAGWDIYERRHIEIIAKLADILSKRMGNKETISIHYRLSIAPSEHPSQYAMNYRTGEPDADRENTSDIKIFCYYYDINTVEILKLVEYAITHKKEIKREQKPASASILLRHVPVNLTSIPASTINEILLAPTSDVITETLSEKIYRPFKKGVDEIWNDKRISYFFQNNQYHVFITERETYKKKGEWVYRERVLKTFDNIFQFNIVGYERALVFDSYNSFYSLYGQANGHGLTKEVISKRHIIDDDKCSRSQPFDIILMSGDRICIASPMRWRTKKYSNGSKVSWQGQYNMIYIIYDDVLIQNADDILDEAAMKQLGIPKE